MISSLILHYRGRVVDAPGGNLLAAVYSELGQAAEARAEVAEMRVAFQLKLVPDLCPALSAI